jgi:2-oxoglutarate dehydrogenase E1 component
LSGRRQPLVVFTPKSMLRLRAAASQPGDFTSGRFEPVLGDPAAPEPAGVRKVILCTGKVFYELLKERDKAGVTDTALLRVEQLYPLPGEEIADALAGYPAATDLVWVQEEPANKGAWPFMALNLPDYLPDGRQLRRVSRPAAAAPATGSQTAHQAEQDALIAEALR